MAEYVLQYGKAQAVVNSIGGELTSYIAENGRQYIWSGVQGIWPGHSPVLFPVIGTTINDQVKINGVPHAIAKHGFAKKMEFSLGKHGRDFVEYTLSSCPQTLEVYPFEFVLHVTHTIGRWGFTTTFLVENKSGEVMPMCIGGHPGFTCPIYEGESFEDYDLVFEKVEHVENSLAPNGGCITGTERLAEFTDTDTLSLRHGLFDTHDALIFANPVSRKLRLINRNTKKGILFDFHKFDALALWTAPNKNAPYICLEPWCGLPAYQNETGNMEEKPYVRLLDPGESFKVSYSMDVLE